MVTVPFPVGTLEGGEYTGLRATLFDPGYVANPLVFCGTVGLAPRGRRPTQPAVGDLVVVAGGRAGRDGIHGATFSSDVLGTAHAELGSVVQIGDPQSRNMTLQEWWGRSGSGKPIGAAEITKKRTHVRGAVGMGHSGSAKDADSQFYITLRSAPELNGKYTVFGQVIKGMDVAAKLQKADILKKASVKE